MEAQYEPGGSPGSRHADDIDDENRRLVAGCRDLTVMACSRWTSTRIAVCRPSSISGPVSLSAISERHQISLSYLEQLFSKLRQHQLVESTRGPGGGYSLARSAEKITMADIVSAVDLSA